MDYPLIIAGNHISRNTFQGSSLFYPQYSFRISNASQLDIVSAIGAVRRSEGPSLTERTKLLERTADVFQFDNSLAEHSVRMTGMPITLIRDALMDIKRIFRQIPETFDQRFEKYSHQDRFHQEKIGDHLSKLFIPRGGYCYAVTPGNDPRAVAIVAANLGYLGIPFIIRASVRDAVAPLIIDAMIAAGFDPHFCNLLYLDRNTPDFERKHFKLLEDCSCIWTFGPSQSIDQTLRYQITGHVLTFQQRDDAHESLRFSDFKAKLDHLTKEEFDMQVKWIPEKVDRFEGKVVIRHESGNCGGILNGNLDEKIGKMLYESIGYANVCTAMKSLMIVDDSNQITQLSELLGDLIVGDPLQEETQVGYIDPRNLDNLAHLLKKNALRLQAFGGERLSTYQARPLLVYSQEDLPDFLGQEIPAYLLTVRTCHSIEEAVNQLNKHVDKPRLGVSFFNLSDDQLRLAIPNISAHITLIDKPTSILVPAFHEGNDYGLLLTGGKIIYR